MLLACTRKVFGAITFNSAAPKWDYAIREWKCLVCAGLCTLHHCVRCIRGPNIFKICMYSAYRSLSVRESISSQFIGS